jgi:hypothetical protein
MMPGGDPAEDLASAVTAGSGKPVPQEGDSTETVSRKDFDALSQAVQQIHGVVTKLADLPERVKQSTRDTIDDRVRKAVPAPVAQAGELAEVLKPFLKEGVTPQQIQDAAVLHALRSGSYFPGPSASESPQASETLPAKAAPDPVASEVGRILKDHGLSGREPELKEWLSQNTDKPLLVKLQGLNDLAEQLGARQAGDVGSIVAGTSGQRATPNLVKEFVDTMLKNRGKGLHVANRIKEQYRRLGVNVDAIDLLRPTTWK